MGEKKYSIKLVDPRRVGKWSGTREMMKEKIDSLPSDSYIIMTWKNYNKLIQKANDSWKQKIQEVIGQIKLPKTYSSAQQEIMRIRKILGELIK